MFLLRPNCWAFILFSLLPGVIFAQLNDPYASLKTNKTFISVDEDDDELTKLGKACCNAAYTELRIRHHYFLNGGGTVCETEALLNSIRRFHKLRSEIDPMPDSLLNAKQLAEFAAVLQKASLEKKKRNRLRSQIEIETAAFKAFKLRADLELLRIQQYKK